MIYIARDTYSDFTRFNIDKFQIQNELIKEEMKKQLIFIKKIYEL